MSRGTERPDRAMLRPRICPLCGGTARGEVFPFGTRWQGELFRNLGCNDCGSSFLDPVPSAEQLVQAYSRAEYHDAHYHLDQQDSQNSMLSLMLPYLRQGGTLLDFGCGNGHFLRLGSAAGFRCKGVEIDLQTCLLAERNSGCEIATAASFKGSTATFDIIHLGDVLKHLPKPVSALRCLERNLASGGRFFVEGPLEDNQSAVNFASRLYGVAKRRLGRPYGTYLLLHLFRTNASAQRRFFTATMGYAIHDFRLGDDGWPYAGLSDSLLRPRSAAHLVKLLIARTSQVTSGLGQALGLPMGNRFASAVSPDQESTWSS